MSKKKEAVSDHTTIQEVHISALTPAEWNYKTAGTEEQIAKLAESIIADKSCGVLAVREVQRHGKLYYEVIDGNHRLEAVRKVGWEVIPVENFGPISLAVAVTIARRRNHTWFQDDLVKLGNLYKDVVLQELSVDHLELIMPEGMNGINNLVALVEADHAPFETPEQKETNPGDPSESDYDTLKFKVSNAVRDNWTALKEQVDLRAGDTVADEKVLDILFGIGSGMIDHIMAGLI